MGSEFLDIGTRITGNVERFRDDRFLTLYKRDGSGGWRRDSLTYRRFVTQAAAFGAALRATGAPVGGRVLLCLRHGWGLHAAIAGCLLHGLVPVVFPQPSPKTRPGDYRDMVLRMAAQLAPDMVVADPDLTALLRDHSPATRSIDDLAAARVGIGDATGLDLPDSVIAGDPERTVLIQYSSGTTGLKKGVVLSARALLDQVDRYAAAIALGPGDAIASWLPLYHDMGLICCLLLPLLKAVPVSSVSPFEWLGQPSVLLEMIARERASLAWMPNFAFAYMASNFADRRPGAFDLSSLRLLTNCSEPLTAESVGAFVSTFAAHGLSPTAVGGCYAMAEATFAVTCSGPGEGVREAVADPPGGTGPTGQILRVMSSGRPLPGTEIRIGDGRRKAGELGEIAVRSPSIMDGYLGVPASDVFDGDGWYRTGDLGFLRDGELYVVGRADDMVIVGGQNVYPHLVEEAVSRVAGIVPGRVAVFGVPSLRGLATADLVVMAETRATGEDDRRRIVAEVSAAVSAATDLAPGRVELVAPMSLRKSTSGKISRNACRTAFLEGLRVASATAAAGDFRSRVRSFVIERLLGGRSVPDDEPLVTTAVIDSLGLAMLTAWLERELGRAIPSPMSVGLERFDSVDALCALADAPVSPRSPMTAYLAALIAFAGRPPGLARPRLLVFGDSVHERTRRTEADQRTVRQLIVDAWPAETALAISHSAYTPLVYREYLQAGVAVGRPADVLVLPINLRSFSPQWDANPTYDMSAHVDALRRFAGAPAQALPEPKMTMTRERFDELMSAFMALPVETPLSACRTVGEFMAVERMRPASAAELQRRLREIAIYQYALPVALDHRQIRALVSTLELARQADMGVLLYFTPLDMAIARAVAGESFAAAVDRNLRTIADPLIEAAQGGRVRIRNWTSALPHGAFFPDEFSEHLLLAGREWLAGQVVAAAREIAGI